MKIRILGNSLRFRLGRSEVHHFGVNGMVEERVRFGPPPQVDFRYRLETSPGNEFLGSFIDGTITVRVPEILVDHWVESERTGIEGSQKLDERTDLHILIEKDFVCLNAHNDEDQSDRYPHPKGDKAC